MRKLTKKLDMTMLTEFILLTAVIAIVALLVFNINEDTRDDLGYTETATCNTTSGIYTGCQAYGATLSSDSAVAKIPKSLKLLATAVVFGAVLFVILRVVPMRTSGTFQ